MKKKKKIEVSLNNFIFELINNKQNPYSKGINKSALKFPFVKQIHGKIQRNVET